MNKNDVLVSVIVPIYNIQDYLEKCIESIINQEYHNLEILLINDGSTDDSYKICLNYETIDNRIKVINKENGGLSDARNKGIECSTGEYVVFIDGDDYVSPDYIKKLLKAITETQADVALCAFSIIDGKYNKTEAILLSELNGVVSGRDLLVAGMSKYGYKYIVVWNKMYKKELFDNIKFEKGKLYEDEYIHFKLFWICKIVAVINEPLYYYVQREGSIIQSPMTIQKINEKCEMHRERIKFYEEKGEKQLFYSACQMYCNWLVECMRSQLDLMDKSYKYKLQKDMRKYVNSAQRKKDNHYTLKIQNILGYINLSIAAYIKSLYLKID